VRSDGGPFERLALVNGLIVGPDRAHEGKALLISGGAIEGVASPGDLGSDIATFDASGCTITPGLVDIHTHGAVGRSFLDGDDAAFSAITAAQARRGVTALLATTSTAPMADIVRCLARTREWMAKAHDGSLVLGAHVEGPYFAPEQAGAQDPAHLRSPDDGTVNELLEFADAMRIVSFAPELAGALELAARLASLGIVAAAGHSNAEDRDLEAAASAGVTHVIHLWSGQSTTVRKGPWRHPGMLEATLASDGLSGELIADGKHLPATLLRLAYRCLGPDKLCLVSDATSGAGLGEGRRFRMGGMEYEVHDGVGMMLDRSAFAGSTTFLDRMVQVMVELAGVPICEAVRMASLTPARVIGRADRKGSLEPGKDADLAVFGPGFEAQRTMIGGRWLNAARPRHRSHEKRGEFDSDDQFQ
jgi:N-acetylglucosamine-6-phosphate deacetylase